MTKCSKQDREKDWKTICCMGYDAALEGRDSTFNPYKQHMSSIFYRVWDEGWEAGMKHIVQVGLEGVKEVRLNKELDLTKALDKRNGGKDAS
jgi:ribosome modulation factor